MLHAFIVTQDDEVMGIAFGPRDDLIDQAEDLVAEFREEFPGSMSIGSADTGWIVEVACPEHGAHETTLSPILVATTVVGGADIASLN